MNITVNGRPRTIPGPASLKLLIEQICRDRRHVIAEVNGNVVRTPQWETRILQNGDTIELVQFVGGG